MRLRAVAVTVWAALTVACFALLEPAGAAVVGALGCGVLVAVSVVDLERRIIPNRIVIPATAVALAVQTIRDPSIEWLVACVAAGLFFLLFALVYPAGLGMGDVKLAAFLGAWLGRDVAVALFLGSIFAVVPAVALLVQHGRAARKMGLPYGPFLAAGGVVALFAGGRLLDAWLT
jgi:leader peptidase (prepilin peptidase)/N-methyltransferase